MLIWYKINIVSAYHFINKWTIRFGFIDKIWYYLQTIMKSIIGKLRASFNGIILLMCPAYERQRYNVTSSLIGWVHSQNDLWLYSLASFITQAHQYMQCKKNRSCCPSRVIWSESIINEPVKIVNSRKGQPSCHDYTSLESMYDIKNCNSIDERSSLVMVMDGCRQAPIHYLIQCWLSSKTTGQWLDKKCFIHCSLLMS